MIWFFFGLGIGFCTGGLLGTICISLCVARRESEKYEE